MRPIPVRAVTARHYPRFTSVLRYLDYDGVPSVSVDEAAAMVGGGDWVLVDVRPSTKAYRIDGALEVPLFGPGFDAGFDSSFDPGFDPGFGSGFDPGFASRVATAADMRGVVLMCDSAAPEDSLSIRAAWELTTASPGYPTAHLKGGAVLAAEKKKKLTADRCDRQITDKTA